jgi:hypothetical protein
MAIHRVSVTISDPDLTAVHMRSAKTEKRIRVKADTSQEAINKARDHYKKQGYKVHDHNHMGELTEELSLQEKGKGLWANIHAKRKRGERAAKPGEEGYPKTLNIEAKDPREYDYEGDMAKSQLRAIIANAQQVHDMLKDNTNMAEWVQSKITLAADYISTVADYMQSEVKEEANLDEESDVYARAEENKRSADAAKKQGDMFAHHLHMADHHDNLAQWHGEKGRHSVADTHAAKSEEHHDLAMQHKDGVNEAWTQGNRNPQRGIKVGDKVRSYDFPGMHDDHYVEGHVVADNAHTYHIRVNKVVRSGKEIPTPAHMAHVEAPKGKGMFSSAYAVHRMMNKEASVAAKAEPAQGAARTFTAMRGKK